MTGGGLRPIALAGYLTIGLAALAIGWSVPLDDFWLTLASGQAIADGADPTRAINFTFTPMRAEALNPQWGAQLLLATVPLGLALAVTVAASLGGLLITLARTARAAKPIAVVIAMLAGLVVLGPHLLPRVQAFSILLLPLMLFTLERWRGRAALPFAAAGIVAVWANLHGAFVVGIILPTLFLLGRIISLMLSDRGSAVLRDRQVWAFAAASVAVLVAPLINPVGVELYGYAVGQASNPVIRAVSTEWQPAWPWLTISMPFWALLVLLGVLRSWRIATPTELLVAVSLALLATTAVRSIPWFTLAVLPLLARSLEEQLERRPMLTRALGPMPRNLTSFSWHGIAPAAAVLLVLFQFVRPSLPGAIARLTANEPVALVDALQLRLRGDEPARVFNEQSWGGYLVYRLRADVRTYLDGRLETGDAETWSTYYEIMNGNAVEALELLDVDWVMIRPEHEALIDCLRSNGFEQIAVQDGLLFRAPGS